MASDAAPRKAVGSTARRMVWIYLMVAGVWIIASTPLAVLIAANTRVTPATIELVKGLGFVAVTGLVLQRVIGAWEARMTEASHREREASEQLRHLEAMRSNFLNGISHELRTPLTALVGLAATIQARGPQLPAAQVALLAERMVVQASRLEDLVTDLHEIDRLLRGIWTMNSTYVDVDAVVRRVVEATPIGTRTVIVRSEPVSAYMDVAKVERIIEHLLDNIGRHTPEATVVEVAVSRDGAEVVIDVADDGPGIDPAVLDVLFEPFTQSATASSDPMPGLGIGLNLASLYATSHGGSLVVNNRADHGAVFTLRLPVAHDVVTGAPDLQAAR